MPYVKPTVHLSRLAGTALKSFTHGYAQTVVAASQSSHAAQNNPTGPLYDNLLGRFRKAERSRLSSAYHASDLSRQPGSGSVSKNDGGLGDSSLEKYFDAWQKHQKNELKEWQQFQFAKRIGWQPPPAPPAGKDVVDSVRSTSDEPLSAPDIKRSYTTSALDNFDKAFTSEAAEAAALEKVNNAIAQEVARGREEQVSLAQLDSAHTPTSKPAPSVDSRNVHAPVPTDQDRVAEPIDEYTVKLVELASTHNYLEIPLVFRALLQSGVQRPSPAAYGALLKAVLGLSAGEHQKVPKALELYSDMLRREVVPDSWTISTIVELVARRAVELGTLQQDFNAQRLRYTDVHTTEPIIFRSSQYNSISAHQDQSYNQGMQLFDRSVIEKTSELSEAACDALVLACVQRGQIDDMTRIYRHMLAHGMRSHFEVYSAMIAAYGSCGDLRSAVEVYDQYKTLALANNNGEIEMARNDNEVYAAVIMAYGSANRLQGGLKFLSEIQAGLGGADQIAYLMETVSSKALMPLALNPETLDEDSLETAFVLVESLPTRASTMALSMIVEAAADRHLSQQASKAFEQLAPRAVDLTQPAMAMLAMHIRNADFDAAEPFWNILQSATPDLAMLQPTIMYAAASLQTDKAEAAVRQSRDMFARLRQDKSETDRKEIVQHIDEAIEMLSKRALAIGAEVQPAVGIELICMMADNGGLIAPLAEHIVARFGPQQIAQLSSLGVEALTRIQASMILDDASLEIHGASRFACLLQSITSRSIMPSAETETFIERALVNLNQSELSRLWNSYRYPPTLTPPITPVSKFPSPPTFDDAFDPYASRTDVKGSNFINDLLERGHGRRMEEAMTKFRNMRRVGRVPKMFTYGKLIEGAAKEHDLDLCGEILQLAKQDVPFDPRYRIVRHGWQQILDHMVAGCLTMGRRDLAANYHQDMLNLGVAPSANTFGLYITTLKENTKTFDEASEAVRVFQRAQAEGVEPTSFLYNALIGKLGKARRIDDCLRYFAEMRNLGIRPTSVTYGTIVNALCRVSDEKFAEEIFEEMESSANYKPRPAPYHSLMQFFLTTKRDRTKVLAYYERMRSKGIAPTVHTYKLLIDAYATLEPVDMSAAEAVLADMHMSRVEPEAVHYASLIHAKGCVLHDIAGAQKLFNDVVSQDRIRLEPCLYQALFEALNANHMISQSDIVLQDMRARGIEFTPYIANALIHGWTLGKDVSKAERAFQQVPREKREPSTYEAMIRAYLAVEDRAAAKSIVHEAFSRGYPSAVVSKIAELVR